MKEIILYKGEICLVGDEDYEEVKKYKWHLDSTGYARGLINRKLIRMHTFIMKTSKGKFTDHLNGNKLDNRRINLRICSAKENARNRRLQKSNTTGFKGVKRTGNNWGAFIKINKKQIWLGTYKNKEEAAQAYDRKAKELFGEFSCLNKYC